MEIGISEFTRSLRDSVGIESGGESIEKTSCENRQAIEIAKKTIMQNGLLLIQQISYIKSITCSEILLESKNG
jgi:hypothetical protein